MGRGPGLGSHAMGCMAPGLTSFGPAPLDAVAIYARRRWRKGRGGESVSQSIGFACSSKPKTAENRARAIENSS